MKGDVGVGVGEFKVKLGCRGRVVGELGELGEEWVVEEGEGDKDGYVVYEFLV